MNTNEPAYRPLGYQPALDGLRAVAIAVVVAFHYSGEQRPFGGGFLGVFLFFVLSGFLITRLLIDEWHGNGRVGLGDFYRRRVARLLPGFLLFGVTMLVAAEAGATIYGTAGATRSGFFAAATYSANWFSALHPSTWSPVFKPMWSLSVEEQFYVLWPITLIVLLRRFSLERVARLVTAAAVVVFLQVALRSFWWPSSLLQMWGTDAAPMAALLLGCAAALAVFTGFAPVRADIAELIRRYWVLASAVLAVFVVAVAFEADAPVYERGGFAIAELCMLVLLGACYLDTKVRRVLSLGVFVYIGQRSYEIYLWHTAIGITMAWVVARLGLHLRLLPLGVLSTAATLVVADASYRFVGRPLRRAIARPSPSTRASRTSH